MLASLFIKNYAIIDHVELEFDSQFNVITGETGAGKSILLGALGLILGDRADTSVMYHQNKPCIVEATFRIPSHVKAKIENIDDIDVEDPFIIRREILGSGKSRAFVNDTFIRLHTLKEIGDHLVDVHNQFDTLSIVTPEEQLTIVDAYAKNSRVRHKYQDVYQRYVQCSGELGRLKKTSEKDLEDLEYIQFQLNELEQADLDNLDEEAIESEYSLLSNSEEVKQVLSGISNQITDSDQSAESLFMELARRLSQLPGDIGEVEKVVTEIQDILERIRDLNHIILDVYDSMDVSEDRLAELDDIIALLTKLKKKHHVTNLEDLKVIRNDLEAKSQGTYDLSYQIEQKEKELKELVSTLTAYADELGKSRRNITLSLQNKIVDVLRDLAMPQARFEIRMEEASNFYPHGKDDITMAFSANKGMDPLEIGNVASGGELSRLALSIKSLVADELDTPTLIFDEIDTGISGAVAVKVGAILKSLSERRQVICITHSPQVAATARHHFYIHKKDDKTRTLARVSILKKEERIQEIAKMLSTDPPTPAALENAVDLLGVQ